jgi:hypothetical protein
VVVPPHSQAVISLLESRPSKAEHVTCVWDLAIVCLYFASSMEVWARVSAYSLRSVKTGWCCWCFRHQTYSVATSECCCSCSLSGRIRSQSTCLSICGNAGTTALTGVCTPIWVDRVRMRKPIIDSLLQMRTWHVPKNVSLWCMRLSWYDINV